jgi:methenyltetrahydrofolate cyclohydrolase
MTKLTDRTFTHLLAAFGSTDPTPGGGSASALAGAVGAALLAMVAGLPKPRAATEDDVALLAEARAVCTELCERLRLLIEYDSDAYDLVVSAYRMPKGTEREKEERSTRIQRALRVATETPLDVMRACASAIEQAAIVARLGNQNASSDVRVAIELLTAGLRGARHNVEINLGSIKDQSYVDDLRSEAERLVAESTAGADAARNT